MINIIPKPLQLKKKQGSFLLDKDVVISGKFPKTQEYLNDLLDEYLGFRLNSDRLGNIKFVLNKEFKEEEYELNITPSQIKITASSEVGAFYAIQSLRQVALLDTLKGEASVKIPALFIHDEPRFAYRGFMLDCSRHFSSVAMIKRQLNMMALFKLNRFHWHFTDDQGWRIEIKKYPKLAEVGSIREKVALNLVGYYEGKEPYDNHEYGRGKYYTQEDAKEIVDYASRLHITVVPEIEMPGHLVAAIASYPEISCKGEATKVWSRYGVSKTIGCCGGEELYKFIYDIIDELVEIFPGPYFHIGGDEVPKDAWKVCPKCQAKIKELGLKCENDLQGYFNNQVLAYLNKKGKTMVAWNEAIEASNLDGNTLIQYWIGDLKENGVLDWLDKGNNIVISSHDHLYMNHLYSQKDLPTFYSVDLDLLGIDAKYEKQIKGIEAPVWTEYIRNRRKMEFNLYPRLMAISEINWTKKELKDYNDFEKRVINFGPMLDAHDIIYPPKYIFNPKKKIDAKEAYKLFGIDPNREVAKYMKHIGKVWTNDNDEWM